MKNSLKHLPILGIFLLAAILFSLPAFQGMKLFQHDYVSWRSMAQEVMKYHEETGDYAMWSNSMFSGMPIDATYTQYNDNNWIRQIPFRLESLLPKPSYMFFFAMVCFYALSYAFRMNRWIGAISSFAFTFASYMPIIIVAGHDTKFYAVASMAAVLAGFVLLFDTERKRFWIGLSVLTIGLINLIGSTHFQIVYYALLLMIFAVIGYLIAYLKKGEVLFLSKRGILALIIAIISVMSCAASLWTYQDYSKQTIRGAKKELTDLPGQSTPESGLELNYAFRWSNGWGELLCGMVPYLYGGGSSQDIGTGSETYQKLTSIGASPQQAQNFVENAPMYWGDQPFLSGPVYFGAIVCFLFVLGLFVVRSKHKWWMLAVVILTSLMSLGSNFPTLNYFLFEHLPLFNKFRTPSMILVVPQLVMTLVAFWGLNTILFQNVDKKQLWSGLKWSTIITAGICLVIVLLGSAFFDFRGPNDANLINQYTQMFGGNQSLASQLMSAIVEDRSSLARNAALRSAILILISAGAIYYFMKAKINASLVTIIIAVLVVFDLWTVDAKYLNSNNYLESFDYEQLFAARTVDLEILKDKDPNYRVLDLSRNTYNDAFQAYHHKNIGGYHAAKLKIYQDLIERQLNNNGKINHAVVNMLNGKYIITPGQDGEQLIPNPQALGNAWFVEQIKWVNTADEEMNALNASALGEPADTVNDFNPAKVAVVRVTEKSKVATGAIGKDSTTQVQMTKYGLENLEYQTNNAQAGFLVCSEIYYPERWTAFIDGKEVPIVRTNYVLRGISVPAGSHKIEFKYENKVFEKGSKIGLVGSILSVFIILVALFFAFFKKQTKTTE